MPAVGGGGGGGGGSSTGLTAVDAQSLIKGSVIYRDDAVRGVGPTPAEYPEASADGDTAFVMLSDQTQEVWQFDNLLADWALRQTIESATPEVIKFDEVSAVTVNISATDFLSNNATHGVAMTGAGTSVLVGAGAADGSELIVSNVSAGDVFVVPAAVETIGADPTGILLDRVGEVTLRKSGSDWVIASMTTV